MTFLRLSIVELLDLKMLDFGDKAFRKIIRALYLDGGHDGGLENGKCAGLENGKCAGLEDGP